MIISRFEAEQPVVIPSELLARLGVKPGEEIAIELVGDRIVIAAAHDLPGMFVNNFASFTEWASEEDCRAFDNL